MRMITKIVPVAGMLALIAIFSASTAQEVENAQRREPAIKHREWVAKSLSKIQTIKIGAAKADLLKIFREEGGLSTRANRTYVYHECPYIKVDVEFKPVEDAMNRLSEYPGDEIIKISKPYLDWSILD